MRGVYAASTTSERMLRIYMDIGKLVSLHPRAPVSPTTMSRGLGA
jgi:hypothetical protein